MRVLAVHTRAPWGPDAVAERDGALHAVGKWASADQSGHVLVVGDLDATRWSAVFRELLGVGGLRDSERGFGFQPSYPAGFWLARVPIDHSLYSDGLVPAAQPGLRDGRFQGVGIGEAEPAMSGEAPSWLAPTILTRWS